MNSIDPVRVEGYKITGFEIFQISVGGPRTMFSSL